MARSHSSLSGADLASDTEQGSWSIEATVAEILWLYLSGFCLLRVDLRGADSEAFRSAEIDSSLDSC